MFNELGCVEPDVAFTIFHQTQHLAEPPLFTAIIVDIVAISRREFCSVLVEVFGQLGFNADNDIGAFHEHVKVGQFPGQTGSALPFKLNTLEFLMTEQRQISNMTPKGREAVDNQGRRRVGSSELVVQLIPVSLPEVLFEITDADGRQKVVAETGPYNLCCLT